MNNDKNAIDLAVYFVYKSGKCLFGNWQTVIRAMFSGYLESIW